MKALSLTQPWATLIAIGAKRYETRIWRPSYRGYIAIHASSAFPAECVELCEREPFASALRRGGYGPAADWQKALPLGAIVGFALLSQVSSVESIRAKLSDDERDFGDFGDDRYAWRMDRRISLRQPIPARGALGLWNWEPPADMIDVLRAWGMLP